MKLIFSAAEIGASMKLVSGIVLQLPGETDWNAIEKFNDTKGFLTEVINKPKHGFSVQVHGQTVSDDAMVGVSEIKDMSLTIELTEAEYLAAIKLFNRHSGTLVSIFKLYYSLVELCGNLAKSFIEDAEELSRTIIKFGQNVEVEKTDSGTVDTPA